VDTKEFYDYLLNRINVQFIPRLDPEQPTFSLTLSKKMTYEQFAAKVGEHLQVEPTHIRFTTIAPSGKPKVTVKYSQQTTLNSILFPGPYAYGTASAQRPDGLFYEVLEMSLKELEQRKAVKVTWLPEGLTKEEEFQLMLPRAGRVTDLLEALQAKANIPADVMNRVRVYEAHNHKWYKDLDADTQIMSIGEYFDVYACAFPEEGSERSITVFHFGFPLKDGEPFSETKKRLSDFMKIKGKPFDKIKFALVTKPQYSKPEYLTDGMAPDFQRQVPVLTLSADEVLWDLVVPGRDDIALGLDHAMKSRGFWGKTDSIFIR
jgi:ubiquitin carboxyl-terminal hydrolase 7